MMRVKSALEQNNIVQSSSQSSNYNNNNHPQTIGTAVAFVAGLLSFLSPCVLPLIPAYTVFITGLSLNESTTSNSTSINDAAESGAGSSAKEGHSLLKTRTTVKPEAVFLLEDFQLRLSLLGPLPHLLVPCSTI